MTVSLNRKVGNLCDSIEGMLPVSAVSPETCRGRFNKDSDSEPYEEDIFYDVKREDRICAQCKQDHSFKPNFERVKTSIERIPELIPLIFKEDSMKYARF